MTKRPFSVSFAWVGTLSEWKNRDTVLSTPQCKKQKMNVSHSYNDSENLDSIALSQTVYKECRFRTQN